MRIALINCYFGKLPNYFPLWLQSCGANPEADFLLFTDAPLPETVPVNVRVIPVSWEALVDRIDRAFSFSVSIGSPYKLTDFKPAYGSIFAEELRDYDYWGYCDVDLIFGRLKRFLEKPMTEKKELIYRLGHLTLFRNTDRMRELFRQPGGAFSYKTVFSKPAFYSFDEHCGLMRIARKQGVDRYYREDMADISCRVKRLTASRQTNYPAQVFYYEDGGVYRAYLQDGEVRVQEFVYIHIQKRKYSFTEVLPRYYILSDRFMPKEPGPPDAETVRALSEYVSEERDAAELEAFRRQKRRDFIKAPLGNKYIWLRQKLSERRFRL